MASCRISKALAITTRTRSRTSHRPGHPVYTVQVTRLCLTSGPDEGRPAVLHCMRHRSHDTFRAVASPTLGDHIRFTDPWARALQGPDTPPALHPTAAHPEETAPMTQCHETTTQPAFPATASHNRGPENLPTGPPEGAAAADYTTSPTTCTTALRPPPPPPP